MFNNDDKSNSKDELLQNAMPKMDISSVFVNLRSTGENDEFSLPPFTASQPPNFSDFESFLTGGNSALRGGASAMNNASFGQPPEWSAFTANNGSALYSAAADFGMGTAPFVGHHNNNTSMITSDNIDINQANAIFQNFPLPSQTPSNENQIPKMALTKQSGNNFHLFEQNLAPNNFGSNDFFGGQKYITNNNNSGSCMSVLQQIDMMINFLSTNNSSTSPYVNNNFDLNYLSQFMQIVVSVMLNSNTSQQGIFKCVNLFYLLAKRSTTRNCLLKLDILPRLILSVLAKFNVVSVVRQCLSVVYYLSSNSQFLHSFIAVTFEDMIINNGSNLDLTKSSTNKTNEIERSSFGIKTLCYCLTNYSKIDPIIFYSAATIHTILLTFPKSREEFCANNCVLMLCQYLNKNNDKFLAIIVDCLCCLCTNNDNAQTVLVNGGHYTQLIRILENKSYEKLVYTTCRLVKMFSTNAKFKKFFIQNNIMHILTNLLLNNSKRLAITSMWSLRNFSDAAANQPNIENLVVICLRFISSQLLDYKSRNNNFSIPSSANNDSENNHTTNNAKDGGGGSKNNSGSNLNGLGLSEPGLVVCSLGVLSNLICNDAYKQIVLNEDGVSAIMHIAGISAKIKEIIEPCFSILRHLTNNKNPYIAGKTIITLFEANFHTFILNLLEPIFQKNDFYAALKSIIVELCHNICKTTFYIANNDQKVDIKYFYCECFISSGLLHKLHVIINFSLHIVKHLNNNETEKSTNFKRNVALYNSVIEEGLMVMFFVCSAAGSLSDQGRITKMFFKDNAFIDTMIMAAFTKNSNMLKCCVGILTYISSFEEGLEALRFYFANNTTNVDLTTGSGSSSNPTGLMLLSHLSNCLTDNNLLDEPLRLAISNLVYKWSEGLFVLGGCNSNSSSLGVGTVSGSSHQQQQLSLATTEPVNNHLSRSTPGGLHMGSYNSSNNANGGEYFNQFLSESNSKSNFDAFDGTQNFR